MTTPEYRESCSKALEILESFSEKRLIANFYCRQGSYCAIGVIAKEVDALTQLLLCCDESDEFSRSIDELCGPGFSATGLANLTNSMHYDALIDIQAINDWYHPPEKFSQHAGGKVRYELVCRALTHFLSEPTLERMDELLGSSWLYQERESLETIYRGF